jgi:hypothetical protein
MPFTNTDTVDPDCAGFAAEFTERSELSARGMNPGEVMLKGNVA